MLRLDRKTLPRLVGWIGLAAALGLLVTLPEEFDTQSRWWTAWVTSAGVLLFAFPLTMLLLWRNGEHRDVVGPDGTPEMDPRGRPKRRRVELPGSKALFHGLCFQSAALLVHAAALLALTIL